MPNVNLSRSIRNRLRVQFQRQRILGASYRANLRRGCVDAQFRIGFMDAEPRHPFLELQPTATHNKYKNGLNDVLFNLSGCILPVTRMIDCINPRIDTCNALAKKGGDHGSQRRQSAPD